MEAMRELTLLLVEKMDDIRLEEEICGMGFSEV